MRQQDPPTKKGNEQKDRQEATDSGAEMEADEDEGNNEEGEMDRDTPRVAPVEVVCVGGDVPPPEENADLPDFIPERAHLLFQGVYRDYPHHNNRPHLDGGVADNAIWKRCWCRLATQWASWYATPSGTVGCCFTAILAAEWEGVLGRSWNSERPLIFAYVILTKI